MARKATHAEKAPLPADLDAQFRAGWTRLEALLDEAKETSPLPDGAPNADAINDWLVGLRRRELTT